MELGPLVGFLDGYRPVGSTVHWMCSVLPVGHTALLPSSTPPPTSALSTSLVVVPRDHLMRNRALHRPQGSGQSVDPPRQGSYDGWSATVPLGSLLPEALSWPGQGSRLTPKPRA